LSEAVKNTYSQNRSPSPLNNPFKSFDELKDTWKTSFAIDTHVWESQGLPEKYTMRTPRSDFSSSHSGSLHSEPIDLQIAFKKTRNIQLPFEFPKYQTLERRLGTSHHPSSSPRTKKKII
jgi:hypothetical protein